MFHRLLLALLGIAMSSPAANLDSLVTELAKEDLAVLRKESDRGSDSRKAVAAFFLAVNDTSARIESARQWFEKGLASGGGIGKALLGASEAIAAREAGANRFESAKWIGQALRHLDDGVGSDPDNVVVHVIRINALQRVPEIFRVNERIAEDRRFLEKHVGGRFAATDVSILMALGNAANRAGEVSEAVRYWKMVADRGAEAKAMSARANNSIKTVSK